ncbi:hypothetical protein [Paracoccus salsus]|uniref:hypothetical protein n=1 Tax=Paracoccus salsus TaxID=2911061 RepID=UPI001F48F14E|nr:hypothetical protein [Paracoccus salsus]MCF3972433.1 hypothetical protein [Paracoccus salsus]
MSTANCTRTCWIAGAGLGLLVWIFTSGIGPLRWFEGLFLGLLTVGLFGVFLIWFLCRGVAAIDSADWSPEDHPTTAGQDQPMRPRGVASEAAGGFLGSPEGDQEDPVAPSGDAQAPSVRHAPAGSDRNDIYGATSRTRPDDQSSGDRGAVAVGGSSSSPDDLKEIKGIGDKIEEALHQHGVTGFAQIADWDEAEIDRMGELLGRSAGRIRSEDWVAQARMLAERGTTGFPRRVEEGKVY